MQAVIALADQVAPSEASILITGESGVGKEVMARYVHQQVAPRRQRPFISVNCAAIPENLLESELFGHEKGAFTGAVARRIGKFEEARRRHAAARRNLRDGRPAAGQAAARAAGARDRPGRRRASRSRSTSGSSPPPTATWPQAVRDGIVPRGPALPAQRREPALPPLRERPGDIIALAEHFVEEVRRRQRRARAAAVGRGRASGWSPTAGPAMCASWRTPCTARCCCRPGRRSRSSPSACRTARR